jgi:hypothetical protein
MHSFQGKLYDTAVKHSSIGGGVTMHAPHRLMSLGMASFKTKAQPEQRLTGCAKRVTQASQTMPFAGHDLQIAHWLGIRLCSFCDQGRRNLRNIESNILGTSLKTDT